jgi:hypothetical protein
MRPHPKTSFRMWSSNRMDAASFILGIIFGVALSGVAFALTVLLFPRLFRNR